MSRQMQRRFAAVTVTCRKAESAAPRRTNKRKRRGRRPIAARSVKAVITGRIYRMRSCAREASIADMAAARASLLATQLLDTRAGGAIPIEPV